MNLSRSTRVACALIMLGQVCVGRAVEIMHWQRLPLAVPLVVGEERVVFVDRNVRVGVPTSIADHLRVQTAGGAVYLRASAPIDPTRLQLQDAATGALILIDIDAKPGTPGQAPLEPVRIVEDALPAAHYGKLDDQATRDLPARGLPRPVGETPVPVVLTRYAAQSLYAPLRTVEAVSGITRVNLPHDLALDMLLPTLPVRATALAAWRLDDDWVTAVRLSNKGAQRLELDPRVLQGDFLTATFQHPDLGPAGRSSDTTVLYLVTRGHGLAGTLLPRISRVDAAANLPASGAAGDAKGAGDEK